MEKSKPILFCDFDGVLCYDRFWRSLPADEYETMQTALFRGNKEIVNDWMRGKYCAEEIVKVVSEETGMPYEKLWEVFVRDCESMQVVPGSLERIENLKDKFITVLITDNMDSLDRFTAPVMKLDEYFNLISNSHGAKMLKNDNEGELFLRYSNQFNSPLGECIFFDDSRRTCDLFTKLGGTSYLVTKEYNLPYHLDGLTKE